MWLVYGLARLWLVYGLARLEHVCDRRRPLRIGKVEERACCNTRWLTEDVSRGLGRYKRESSGFSRSLVTITPQHHVTQDKTRAQHHEPKIKDNHTTSLVPGGKGLLIFRLFPLA